MRNFMMIGLIFMMVLAASAVTLAVPPTGVQDGKWMLFADLDWWSTNIGGGYGITDSTTVGGVYDVHYRTYGIFGNWELD